MQLTAAVMLIVLFIKFSMVNVDVTNNDHFIPQHIAKNIASIDEISTLQNPNISTELLIAEGEITKGYIISSSFWEQQVGAALNLWTLAKWAAATGYTRWSHLLCNQNLCSPIIYHIVLHLVFYVFRTISIWIFGMRCV